MKRCTLVGNLKNMNSYRGGVRKRSQNLLIVEGHHEKISCFVDAADIGRLYINYPMIESYRHLCRLPDDDFAERI